MCSGCIGLSWCPVDPGRSVISSFASPFSKMPSFIQSWAKQRSPRRRFPGRWVRQTVPLSLSSTSSSCSGTKLSPVAEEHKPLGVWSFMLIKSNHVIKKHNKLTLVNEARINKQSAILFYLNNSLACYFMYLLCSTGCCLSDVIICWCS